MRSGRLSCGVESKGGCQLYFWLLVMGSVLFTHAVTTKAFAKKPGQKHCYKNVCHKVKTLAETKALVGQSLFIVTSHYDSPLKDRFNRGKFTSSGTKFNAEDATATASSDFPDGTELLVWNPKNGRAAHVRVTDFGPFHSDRKLDLTRSAAEALGFAHQGVAKLRVTVIAPPPPDEPRYKLNRTYRQVGGFIGVYRKEELASLSSLLIAQAERRRQPPKPVLVAARTPAGAEPKAASASAPDRSVSSTDQRDTATVTSVAYQSKGAAGSDVVVVNQTLPGREALTSPLTGSPSGDRGIVRSLLSLENGSSIDIEAKIAALSFSKTQSVNRISDVPDGMSAALREKNFKQEFAALEDSSQGARPIFEATNRIGRSLFSMDYGNQGFVFLVLALILSSSAFFAAYFSVSRGVIGVPQNDPLPTRRFFENRNDYAEVEFVKPPEDDIDDPDTELVANQIYRPRAARLNLSSEVTHIKRGSKISGNLTMEGGVIVEGSIEGDCICDTLTIGSGGIVLGHVKAKMAIIDGRVDGHVDVRDLHVKDEAHIKGEVRYCDLALDHGAVLEARCKRVASL